MENLKQRVLTGWTFTRVLYLGMGIVVIINAIMNQQWFGVPFGAYFASMGLFSFGCAAGACFDGNCNTEPNQQNNIQVKIGDVVFEEIKTK